MIKECVNPKCKKSFQAKRKTQKYCSGKCRKYVEKNKNVDHEETKIDGVPLREFYCRECGGRVVIKTEKDKRTVFCCVQHERKYWKHPGTYSHRGTTNLGMSGGMSLNSLKRREKLILE